MNRSAAREIATGVGFSEGPVIRRDGEVVFVSIDQGKLYRIKEGARGRGAEVFADLGGGPNGATEGADGTIYVTQTGGRWGPRNPHPDWTLGSGIQAVNPAGETRWITTGIIAPNDLCFGPDGLLWVTDPTRYRNPRDDGRLFRVDVRTGQTELLCSLPWYPNGIGFGLEDDALYVARTGPPREIIRFPIEGGRLGKPELFAKLPGHYSSDGFAFDAEGNLVTGSPAHEDGEPGLVHTFDRNGKLIDAFNPNHGKTITNVALDANRTLIITASDTGAVLAVDNWPHAGLPLHPFRARR